MSSILKALKKLEKEQIGQRGDPESGRSQYLAPVKRRRTGRWLLLAAVAGLLLVAGGMWFLDDLATPRLPRPALPIVHAPPPPLPVNQPTIETTVMKGEAVKAVTSPATPAVASPAPRAAVDSAPVKAPASSSIAEKKLQPAVATVRPASKPATLTTPVPVRPAPPAAAVPVAARVPSPPPLVVKKPQAPAPKPANPAVPVAVSPVKLPPPQTAPAAVEQVHVERHVIPAPGSQWSAAHLKVTDIFPDSGGGSMAIVNGLPVMVGTRVEDALVEEIHADRVIFSIDGHSVPVFLSGRR